MIKVASPLARPLKATRRARGIGGIGKETDGMSKTVAKITIGALIGGVVGFLIGLVLASTSIGGNPFLYASIGIAVGAGVSTVFGNDERD
jgi:hypothetical protein